MKHNRGLVFILFFMISFALYSQTYEVEYYYDAAGNRIERNIIYLSSSTADSENGNGVGSYADTHEQTDYLSETLSENMKFSIYPNPVTSVLNLDITSDSPVLCRYQIINSAGSVLQSGKLNAGTNLIHFDNYPEGAYLLQIQDEKNQPLKEYKIVKQ